MYANLQSPAALPNTDLNACLPAEAQKRTMDGTTQLTAEDLMGWSKARELANQQDSFPTTN